jgi:hypothetical protein
VNRSIVDLIENNINAYVSTLIDELQYHTDKEYDEYTVMEFLTLYRIQRLFELNLISKKECDSLIELFEMRQKLLEELVKEQYKNLINLMREFNNEPVLEEASNDKIDSLREQISGIDCIFKKYHLDQSINLLKIIDFCIKGEHYEKQDIEELKKFYIRTKKKE